jgi:hypothetical protein
MGLLTLNHPTSCVRRRTHSQISGLELWNLFALVLLKGFDERDESRKIGRLECVEANHHGAISPPI